MMESLISFNEIKRIVTYIQGIIVWLRRYQCCEQSILLSLGQSINHDNALYISNYYIIILSAVKIYVLKSIGMLVKLISDVRYLICIINNNLLVGYKIITRYGQMFSLNVNVFIYIFRFGNEKSIYVRILDNFCT